MTTVMSVKIEAHESSFPFIRGNKVVSQQSLVYLRRSTHQRQSLASLLDLYSSFPDMSPSTTHWTTSKP